MTLVNFDMKLSISNWQTFFGNLTVSYYRKCEILLKKPSFCPLSHSFIAGYFLTSLQVCDTATYLGYDSILGLCKCKVDDLEEVCDVECRLAQRYSLSFICPSNNIEPFVEVRNLQGDVQVC